VRRRDSPGAESKFFLSADVYHTARGLQEIRFPDVMSSFFPVDRALDKFSQVEVVSTASQNSV
jgi:hypothetical protein